MAVAEKEASDWEVVNIPPNQEYEITVRQEGGGIITVIGRMFIGYQRFVNPDSEGADIYRPCMIIEGLQKDTKRPVLQHLPLSALQEKVKLDSGPIAKKIQRSRKKRTSG
ncbi:MAG: hypothetical protein HYW07_09585 [Candidatus Latescibacteria bacterium]|nr:hypothetical protein [Candidatus Latescibacterota bacterium]